MKTLIFCILLLTGCTSKQSQPIAPPAEEEQIDVHDSTELDPMAEYYGTWTNQNFNVVFGPDSSSLQYMGGPVRYCQIVAINLQCYIDRRNEGELPFEYIIQENIDGSICLLDTKTLICGNLLYKVD